MSSIDSAKKMMLKIIRVKKEPLMIFIRVIYQLQRILRAKIT